VSERDEYGYIKISRKAYQTHRFWNEKRVFSRWEAFEDLIQLAAWKDHGVMVDGASVTIRRGEIFFSLRSLAQRWAWSRTRVHRFFQALIEDRTLSERSLNKKRNIYLLEKYGTYQGREASKKPPKSHRKATTEVREEGKDKKTLPLWPPPQSDATSGDGSTGLVSLATLADPFSGLASLAASVGAIMEHAPSLASIPAFVAKWEEWLRFRRQVKRRPVSEEAGEKWLRKFEEMGPEWAIATIELSIANDWQGLFPQKVEQHGATAAGRLTDYQQRSRAGANPNLPQPERKRFRNEWLEQQRAANGGEE
jgi:hypothetical protein